MLTSAVQWLRPRAVRSPRSAMLTTTLPRLGLWIMRPRLVTLTTAPDQWVHAGCVEHHRAEIGTPSPLVGDHQDRDA